MMFDATRPVYTIGIAAEILGVHPRTLRLYEDAGLIRPCRKNNRRFYSPQDVEWIGCVRFLIHEKGLNQAGLRRLLAGIPCWEIRRCSANDSTRCPAVRERTTPCWDLARRSHGNRRKCYECAVYVGASDHLLDAGEREEARAYMRAD